MSMLLRPENRKHFIVDDKYIQGLDEKELKRDIMMKLEEYYYHSMLYASDDVIKAIKRFLKIQSEKIM